MAVAIQERTGPSGQPYISRSHTGRVSPPRRAEGFVPEGFVPFLLAWLSRPGGLAAGIVLTLVGMFLRAALIVALLAAPFVGIVLVVLLFGLLIEGFGLLLKAAGLLH